jgi:diguanylate cyclase (GGDEF)-like protein
VSVPAQSQTAEDGKWSRWDEARLRLIVPIGVIVAIAIACLVVAIFTSARRADEVSLKREQQLIEQALAGRGARVLRELESVATTTAATQGIRDNYDVQWVERHVGNWLEAFFNHDLVLIVDGSDQVRFARSRASGDIGMIALPAPLLTIVDQLRGRLAANPDALAVAGAPDPHKPGRAASCIVQVMDKPAIVAAAAVGSDSDLADGNAGAPIVISVKYIDPDLLREIGDRLQMSGLHVIDGISDAGDLHTTAISDPQGDAITRLAWKSTQPGGQVAGSALPFIAVAIAGFAFLAGLVVRHTRRTTQAIAAGESQLRHLALHDPVCGLPNRIYFAERLESAIGEVRRGGSSAAVFYIDLDHFKDVNDTLGHHIGDELILNVTQRLSRVMRGEDLVARLGGDEFAIITSCPSDSYSLQAIAGRIIAAVCAPYSISGHNINIGASIGIAVIDRRARDAADILRYADMALYRAKNEGRNRACIYDAAMDADLSQRKLLESDLLHAVRNNGLAAFYQPIVNSSGDKMVAVEALGPLDAPDRRRDTAVGVHSDCREFRPHRRARRMDAAPRLPRWPQLAGTDRGGERVAAAIPPI